MSFRTRILLALIAVGALPAALVSLFSFGANRDELERAASAAQSQVALEAADNVGQQLSATVDGLRRTVDYLPVESLSRDELAQVLSIPFRQLQELRALTVLGPDGAALAPPLVRGDGDRGHLGAFARSIPLERALTEGLGLGDAATFEDGTPWIAVAVRLSEQPKDAAVVAGLLSLSGVTGHLARLTGSGHYVALFDGDRRLFSAGAGPVPPPEPRAQLTSDWLTSVAKVPGTGWTLVVAQPAQVALGPARRIAQYTLYWAATALLVALVLGFALSSGLSRPVQALSKAAQAVAGGDYAHRAREDGPVELKGLAHAFNDMAAQIQQRDREIRAFNQELQQRVDQKAAELQAARDQVERSRRLNAMASLGAGMTHELNNPLTSIMGLTEVVRQELPEGSAHAGLLQQVLEDAERIAAIVDSFRQLTEAETRAAEELELGSLVDAAVAEQAGMLEDARVKLQVHKATALPNVRGKRDELRVVVTELLKNAAQAMPSGGTLEVHLRAPEPSVVRLDVTDTGVGIPPELKERIFDPFFTTKRTHAGTGMGLSVSHRIVEAHHGRILVASEPGHGSTFSVVLPAAGGKAHLK